MYDATHHISGPDKRCGGDVRVTEAHWDEARHAVGDNEKKQRNYLLAEAAFGCTSKCGCVESSAPKFETQDDGEHIIATCNQSPTTRDLGSTIM
jgi:hypothetical protein